MADPCLFKSGGAIKWTLAQHKDKFKEFLFKNWGIMKPRTHVRGVMEGVMNQITRGIFCYSLRNLLLYELNQCHVSPLWANLFYKCISWCLTTTYIWNLLSTISWYFLDIVQRVNSRLPHESITKLFCNNYNLLNSSLCSQFSKTE